MVRQRRCILGCKDHVHLFRPVCEEARELWRRQLNLDTLGKNHQVCDKHFADEMYAGESKRFLSPTAIPIKILPENGIPIAEEFSPKPTPPPKQSNVVPDLCAPEVISDKYEAISFENDAPINCLELPFKKDVQTQTSSHLIVPTPREMNLAKRLRITNQRLSEMESNIETLKKIIRKKDGHISFLKRQLCLKRDN